MQRSVTVILLLLLSLLCTRSATAVDENLLAHDLFNSGEFARAAEIFTDPAWKGAALYRSGQWWRAAEAFVRADDAASQYNLGNCYIRLGYYELALDAYLQALSIDSSLVDAEHNATIVRQLLALNSQDQSAQQSLQSRRKEIDQIETDSEEQQGSSQNGDDQAEPSERQSDSESETEQNAEPTEKTSDQNGGGNKSEKSSENTSADPGKANVQGQRAESNTDSNPSGGSDSHADTTKSESSGVRTALEQAQATEQWLNQINHDPNRFLQSRIKLEIERRQAAGQGAPAGGSAW